MYWIDGDTLNFTSAAVSDPTAALPVTISHLDEGDHTISWRVADNRGVWSECVTDSFTFTKTVITAAMITLNPATFEYSAEDITPDVMVLDGDTPLILGEDYDLAITDNHDVGTATVAVTGKGAYKDSDNATFTITQAPLTVTADAAEERHATTTSYMSTAPSPSLNQWLSPVSSPTPSTPTPRSMTSTDAQ